MNCPQIFQYTERQSEFFILFFALKQIFQGVEDCAELFFFALHTLLEGIWKCTDD